MFASLFGRPKRDRFTLAELRRLNDLLVQHRGVRVTGAVRDVLVETFREIAELMIWGDQNEPGFFDLFVEQGTLAHFSHFMTAHRSKVGARGAGLTLQLLQTLSIMIQNTRQETSLFYLFSNNHINELIEADYDFDDEEVMAYYISFLKTISLKLNEKTVQFFFIDDLPVRGARWGVTTNTSSPAGDAAGHPRGEDASAGARFPLYTSAVRFLGHPESMVRAAVRTIVLNIFGVCDPGVRAHLLSPNNAVGWQSYVPQVVAHIGAQAEHLDGILLSRGAEWGTAADVGGGVGISNITAELGDLLYYVNDILCLPDPGLEAGKTRAGEGRVNNDSNSEERVEGAGQANAGSVGARGLRLTDRAAAELWDGLVEPRLLRSLTRRPPEGPRGPVATGASEAAGSREVGAGGGGGGGVGAGGGGGGGGGDEGVSTVVSLFVLSRLVASCAHEGTLSAVATALLHPTPENLHREAFIGALQGVDITKGSAGGRGAAATRGDLTAAAVNLLATLIKSRDLDEGVLEAGGALPACRCSTKVLLGERDAGDNADQDRSEGTGFKVGTTGGLSRSDNERGDSGAVSNISNVPDEVVPSEQGARSELIDALIDVVSRNNHPPPAVTKECAAWVLCQLVLLPATEGVGGGGNESEGDTCASSAAGDDVSGGDRLTEGQWGRLDTAATAAKEAFMRELDGPWGDAAAPLLCVEWPGVRRGMVSPVLQDDAVVSAIQQGTLVAGPHESGWLGGATGSGGEEQSDNPMNRIEESAATAGLQLIDSVRSLALLTMLCGSLRTGVAPPVDVPQSGAGQGHLGDPGAVVAAANVPAVLKVKTLDELEIREGSRVTLPPHAAMSEGGGGSGPSTPSHPAFIACRVAFEAGVERSVKLTVAARAHRACVSTSLLLVETIGAPGTVEDGAPGIARAVAPLAGCTARVDQSHKKWLHIRVRSPFSCLTAVARSYPMNMVGGGGGKGRAAARRKLQDGHWTLAFADEETCAQAKMMVDQYIKALRDACRIAVAPLTKL